MSTVELRTTQVGPWGMNTYAYICTATNQSVLIDPGGDPGKLREMLGDSTPVAIWLTHTHIDHVSALAEMLQQLKVPLVMHPGTHANGFDAAAFPDVHYVNHGETLTLGEQRFQVYHTPGHIGDQICFTPENNPHYVVGDTIFAGGPGRTWSTEGFRQTLDTLRDIVLSWPDSTYCYPGHGPSFRLGDLRSEIEAFIAKNHGDFYGDAEWGM